jgi:hypothetical protein
MLKGTDVNESSSWIRVSAVEFASGFFQLQSECHDRGEALALCSFCEDSSSGELHIPIMDFRIESETGAHLNLLKEVLTKVGQTDGVLLNSGKSYHYYGFRLLTERDWRRFMVTCLLLGPLVDIRYISHRLLAGTAALRLMTAPGKPKAPEVVAYLKG